MYPKKSTSGFTLIEILIALMIFAIMGVLAAMSLHSIINTHEKLKKSDAEIMQLQMAITLMRRDIMQVIDRKIQVSGGTEEPAFMTSMGGIAFTRAGLFNPLNISQQSNMQRVGYALQGGNLVRLTWDVLDQAPKSTSEAQILLKGVRSIEWQFIDSNGKKSTIWPPSETTTTSIAGQPAVPILPLPVVVLMVMHLDNDNVIQGVFPVPSRGSDAATTSTP
ncbi:MAG: type II secretion system minor pseudopilin GspJ [Gammaproteobacteria bacterium]|nr:type II secretion system minor pseudopilin GspJ [Gammaproteobacteria bacterium]